MLEFRVKTEEESPKITTFEHKGANTTIEVRGLEVRSLCSHHLLPFFGSAKIKYIPKHKKAGLSKFQRALDYIANQPQDQEILTERYLEFLVREIDPVMLEVEITCHHTCMSVRGVKCGGSETITTLVYKCEVLELLPPD